MHCLQGMGEGSQLYTGTVFRIPILYVFSSLLLACTRSITPPRHASFPPISSPLLALLILAFRPPPCSVRLVVPIVTVNSVAAVGVSVTVGFQSAPLAPPAPSASIPVNTLTCASTSVSSGTITQTATLGLQRIVGAGYGGTVAVSMCPTAASIVTATAYMYDSYPMAAVELGQPHGFGAMKSFSVNSLQCCGSLGVTSLPVLGAQVIKITNALSDFLHLTEIQVRSESVSVL